jgi:hypothetical protein
MTATSTVRTGIAARVLVTPTVFDRLVRRVVVDDRVDHALAVRIVDQALAFLAACAHNTGARLAPSRLVDVGWHVFLLHTHDYAVFCDRLAGRFLHHVPDDSDTAGHTVETAHETIRRTIAAISEAGYVVDLDLWSHADAGDCTGCHNGCHDDPPPHR